MSHRRFDRCRACGYQVLWATRVQPGRTERRVCLNHHEIWPTTHEAVGALVVVEGTAYSPTDLAELVMERRQIALEDAFDVIRADFPWHHYHSCDKDRRPTT